MIASFKSAYAICGKSIDDLGMAVLRVDPGTVFFSY
jgi:hypothetical protein